MSDGIFSFAPGAINSGPYRNVMDGQVVKAAPGFDPRSALPENKTARKMIPIATGLLDYFPLAVVAVAALSAIGNEQHNPGQARHWDRAKSGDESDALMRHFLERGTNDTDGVRHSTKVAWRALALLQKELEAARVPVLPSLPKAL